MKKLLSSIALASSLVLAPMANAADYVVDTRGAHASVEFKIKHLGYSWLTGRFNNFDGEFSYDAEKPSAAAITMNVDVTSVDSNHAERDKHLRSDDFLDVKKFAKASFTSKSFTWSDANHGKVTGTMSLNGVSKDITLDLVKIGEGKDPWGGYRVGFEATTVLMLKEFGYKFNLGPASETLELTINVEGIRKK